MNRRDFLQYGLASFAAAALPLPAFAAFPERPIKLIVPFSPGGATDVVGRLWAERMKTKFGTVVIENKGGGGGVIGATEVARSTPNGETLLFGNSSTQVIIPAIAEKPPYDPVKDFQAVYMMAISPTCIVVHESVPVKTLKEFIDYARANPAKLSYGSAGAGTMTNLSGELFKELIGAQGITHIPYKGSAPGVTDLASGHIPMMTPNVGGPLLQFHATGKVRILAIAANKRLAAAPDIPTAVEAGLPGMVAANFNGLFAPVGVPKDVVKALADETKAAMADRQLQDLMIKSGFEPVLDSGPEPAQKEVESEYARWTPIIKKIGFKVQ
ncbi:MAG: tripartite tricarboxylate transporter substrate binding protein [Hyphomicrobiales bacterium]|nr:tripartite tricarboxylate transporter substrate binding protein [Alphaproteobacteria bacterium]